MILIGYSGHAFVVYGILNAAGKKITGYCDVTEKEYNPFGLLYYGNENSEAASDTIKKMVASLPLAIICFGIRFSKACRKKTCCRAMLYILQQ